MPTTSTAFWQENAKEIPKLFDEGLSFSQIARHLGVTKSAVGGQIRRAEARGKPLIEKNRIVWGKHDKFIAEQYAAGMSLNAISKLIGIHRTTISYRLSRLGIEKRPPPAPKPKPESAPVFRLQPDHVLPVTAPIGIVRECQWPEGHPRENGFRFCGERPAAGRSYCETHCRRAYIKWGAQNEQAA